MSTLLRVAERTLIAQLGKTRQTRDNRVISGPLRATVSKEEGLIGHKEVAALIGISVRTFDKWHKLGRPVPPRFRFSRRYRYRRSEVLAWIEAHRIGNAAP